MAIVLFFLLSIPESAGLIALSLALARVPLRWQTIIPTAIVMSIILYIIRSLPFTFGLHTVVMILLLVVFITKTTTVNPSKNFLAVFTSFAILAVLEHYFLNLFLGFMNIDLQVAMAEKVLWYALGIPHVVVILLLGLLVSRCLKPTDHWHSLNNRQQPGQENRF